MIRRTTLATKADLQLLKQELKIDTQSLRQELTSLINASVAELRQETALIRKGMEILSGRTDARIDMLSTTMTAGHVPRRNWPDVSAETCTTT